MLESNLGVTLFDRSRRTPELTPLANAIVLKARVLIKDLDSLEEDRQYYLKQTRKPLLSH